MAEIIKLAFTGDILCYQSQNYALRRKFGRYDYDTVFEGAATLLGGADYVCGSLETPISNRSRYTSNPIVFNSPSSLLESLKNSGFNLLTTANNHCLDRGIRGLQDTIHNLVKCGMDYTGTRLSKAEEPFLLKDFGGFKIAFVAFTYGTNEDANGVILKDENHFAVNLFKPQRRLEKGSILSRSKQTIVRKIYNYLHPFPKYKMNDCGKMSDLECEEVQWMESILHKASSLADKVVLCLHSGGQFSDSQGDYTKAIIEKACSAGADIVICNHNHCILPLEERDGRIIANCLGNFTFTPGDGYFFDDVYADYSAVLFVNIEMDSGDMAYRVSFMKSVVDEDGISRVLSVDSLLNQCQCESERSSLENDLNQIKLRLGSQNRLTWEVSS